MTLSRSAIITAAVFLAFTFVDVFLTHVQAEDANSMGVDNTAAVPVTLPVETSTVDTTVTIQEDVVVKRTKNDKTKIETLPGEKLTVKQVLVLLKTKRDLSGKNLSGLQLVGINLGNCDLKGIDLSYANLQRADLSDSNLERADLTGANLRMSSLRQSGMTGAKIERAIFDGAIWKDGSICPAGSIGQCPEPVATIYRK